MATRKGLAQHEDQSRRDAADKSTRDAVPPKVYEPPFLPRFNNLKKYNYMQNPPTTHTTTAHTTNHTPTPVTQSGIPVAT